MGEELIEPIETKRFTDNATNAHVWVKIYKTSGKIDLYDDEGTDLRLRALSYNFSIIYKNLITDALVYANTILNPTPPTP